MCALAECDYVFVPFPRQARLHQARGPFGDDNLVMCCDMIAMSVRDEREIFSVPRIEPDLLIGEVNAAFISNLDHTN